jgi:hypothetical protein
VGEKLAWLERQRDQVDRINTRSVTPEQLEQIEELYVKMLVAYAEVQAILQSRQDRQDLRTIGGSLDPTAASGTYDAYELVQQGHPKLAILVLSVAWVPVLGPRISRGVRAGARAAQEVEGAAAAATAAAARAEGRLEHGAASAADVPDTAGRVAGPQRQGAVPSPDGRGLIDPRTGTRITAPATPNPAAAARRAPAPDNYRGRYMADRHTQGRPRLPDDWDVHHRIPQKYRDHPELKDFDFHQPSNLQGVKGSRADVNTHQRITNDWEEFGRQNPNATRAQIEDFAKQLDTKYANDWFK